MKNGEGKEMTLATKYFLFVSYALSICPDKIFFVLDKMFFVPDKIIFVPDKITFVPDKIFFVPDKNFCPRLKSSYLLGKRIENYFKLWKTFFP